MKIMNTLHLPNKLDDPGETMGLTGAFYPEYHFYVLLGINITLLRFWNAFSHFQIKFIELYMLLSNQPHVFFYASALELVVPEPLSVMTFSSMKVQLLGMRMSTNAFWNWEVNELRWFKIAYVCFRECGNDWTITQMESLFCLSCYKRNIRCKVMYVCISMSGLSSSMTILFHKIWPNIIFHMVNVMNFATYDTYV